MKTLLEAYEERLAQGLLTADADQRAAAAALGAFCPARAGFFRRARRAGGGFYLHGGVGRGKTMIMDLFFETAPAAKKRRVHFHAFMLEVHDFLHARRAAMARAGRIDGDLLACADHIAENADLLCFDEFHVKDVADAMILGRLFTALFARGVNVVMTSNLHPDDLYRDGLQRDRFLPFIALLKERLSLLPFTGERDYRLGRLREMRTCCWPHDAAARRVLEEAFAAVAGSAGSGPVEIPVKGRVIHVRRAAREIAWFTFDEICGQPKSAVDYLALAKTFRAMVIEDIPHFSDGHRDALTRFVTLVDTLYDSRVQVVFSSAAPPEELYRGDDPAAFARTASRLVEMQSQDYRRSI